MSIFKRQIIKPKWDSVFLLAVGAVCLPFAVLPPYGHRTIWFAFLSAANFFNGWRLRRKIAAVKDAQKHSDS